MRLAVGCPPAGTRWVVVADRGADLHEFLQQCHTQDLGLAVRAAQDRALAAGPTKRRTGRFFELARAQPRRYLYPGPARAAAIP